MMRKVRLRDLDSRDSIFHDVEAEVLLEDDGVALLLVIGNTSSIRGKPIVVMGERARWNTDIYEPAGPFITMKLRDPDHWVTMLTVGLP